MQLASQYRGESLHSLMIMSFIPRQDDSLIESTMMPNGSRVRRARRKKSSLQRQREKREKSDPSPISICFMTTVSFESVPVSCGDVKGHLIISGPEKFLGRVVDTKMKSSLDGGCLRIGTHANRSFYTSNRSFTVSKSGLSKRAHVLMKSDYGIQFCAADRMDIRMMVRAGQSAIDSRFVYRSSLQDAFLALHQASTLPPPSTVERLLQISMGGDPKSELMMGNLMIGNFIPCQRLSANPNITIRCACC
mmetsp:Transcript_8949/g.15546  ORF Transcript_8949/g.15546 Transcript_8949/m.15546 type:complete len:249 (+) Transcript_8949:140-886(+)